MTFAHTSTLRRRGLLPACWWAGLLPLVLVAAALPALGAPADPAAPSAPHPPTVNAPVPSSAAADPASPASDPLLHLLLERGVVQAGLAGLQPAVALAQQARGLASDAVIAAMAFLDLPYTRGGTTAEGGFDCSGFTRYVFKHTLGLLLPRSAEQQALTGALQPVAADELKPGDLVFFNTMRKAFSHVGIYVGEGRFVHAPRAGATVRLDSMRQAYWATRYEGARRPPLADTPPQLGRGTDARR